MAAAAITVVGVAATIESDATGAVITNGPTDQISYHGELRNHGPSDVWCFISQDSRDTALTSDVVTTGAQAQNQVPLPAGATIVIRRDYKTLAHKTAAGAATLSWVPY